MKSYRIIVAVVMLGCLYGPLRIAAQDPQEKSGGSSPHWYDPSRYNPLKLIKRSPKSANDQLASDADLEKRLTTQLQVAGFLAANKDLQDACSDFKDLAECIAVLRVSRTLQIEFSCLKWDVTGVKPKPVADKCAGPAGGKAMRLDRAIDLLKPDADARGEARKALEKARNDIKDASS
jgi:hypothetical protein